MRIIRIINAPGPRMIVCVCNAVSDREIRLAVDLGADSLGAIQTQLGVSTCCGRCSECASAIVASALGRASAVAEGAD